MFRNRKSFHITNDQVYNISMMAVKDKCMIRKCFTYDCVVSVDHERIAQCQITLPTSFVQIVTIIKLAYTVRLILIEADNSSNN
jgi:hypothetical protein